MFDFELFKFSALPLFSRLLLFRHLQVEALATNGHVVFLAADVLSLIALYRAESEWRRMSAQFADCMYVRDFLSLGNKVKN